MSKPNEPKNPQLIIDRMKIRLEELQEQMPVIAELEARIEELEAENDHTAFDALAEKYELAKDKIKTLEAITKAVAHIGIDFYYGKYELEDKIIDQAREYLKEAQNES